MIGLAQTPDQIGALVLITAPLVAMVIACRTSTRREKKEQRR